MIKARRSIRPFRPCTIGEFTGGGGSGGSRERLRWSGVKDVLCRGASCCAVSVTLLSSCSSSLSCRSFSPRMSSFSFSRCLLRPKGIVNKWWSQVVTSYPYLVVHPLRVLGCCLRLRHIAPLTPSPPVLFRWWCREQVWLLCLLVSDGRYLVAATPLPQVSPTLAGDQLGSLRRCQGCRYTLT